MTLTRGQKQKLVGRESVSLPRRSHWLRGFSPGGTPIPATNRFALLPIINASVGNKKRHVSCKFKQMPRLEKECELVRASKSSSGTPEPDIPDLKHDSNDAVLTAHGLVGHDHVMSVADRMAKIEEALLNDVEIIFEMVQSDYSPAEVSSVPGAPGSKEELCESVVATSKAEERDIANTTLNKDLQCLQQVDKSMKKVSVLKQKTIRERKAKLLPVISEHSTIPDEAIDESCTADSAWQQWEAEKQRTAEFRELFLSPIRKQEARVYRAAKHLKEDFVGSSKEGVELQRVVAETPMRSSRFRIVAGRHVCDRCTAEFSTDADLLAHTKAKHPVEVICELCSERFEKPNQLAAHRHTEHSRCKVCGQVFAGKEQLKAHSVTHVEEHYCAQCRSSCKSLRGYMQHVKSHKHQHIQHLVHEAFRIGSTQADPDSLCIETAKPRFVNDKSLMKVHELPLLALLKSPTFTRPSSVLSTAPVQPQSPFLCPAANDSVVQGILDSAAAMTPRSHAFYLHEMNMFSNVDINSMPGTTTGLAGGTESEGESCLPIFGGDCYGAPTGFSNDSDSGFSDIFVPNYEMCRNDNRDSVSGLMGESCSYDTAMVNWQAANAVLLDDGLLFNPNEPAMFTGF